MPATTRLKIRRRGEPNTKPKTMKHALAILIGVNATVALLIIVLNHQLP